MLGNTAVKTCTTSNGRGRKAVSECCSASREGDGINDFWENSSIQTNLRKLCEHSQE